jgi:NADPH:quinone reductase-like Zn-dependent oxidoreductase
VAVSPNLATPLKIGDKVAGAVHGGIIDSQGSHAEYIRVESDLVIRLPEGFNMEEAAVWGVGFGTVCHVSIVTVSQKVP